MNYKNDYRSSDYRSSDYRSNDYRNGEFCPNCIPQETVIQNVQLATAYVPFQKFCTVMSPLESLFKGTAFPELFSPYSKREYINLEPETCSRSVEMGRY